MLLVKTDMVNVRLISYRTGERGAYVLDWGKFIVDCDFTSLSVQCCNIATEERLSVGLCTTIFTFSVVHCAIQASQRTPRHFGALYAYPRYDFARGTFEAETMSPGCVN